MQHFPLDSANSSPRGISKTVPGNNRIASAIAALLLMTQFPACCDEENGGGSDSKAVPKKSSSIVLETESPKPASAGNNGSAFRIIEGMRKREGAPRRAQGGASQLIEEMRR